MPKSKKYHLPRRRVYSGFSLMEIMVSVGIMAILAGLAGPSFTPMMDRWRVREAVENMTSSLYYARSEAIKRGGRVGMQKVANNTNGCTLASSNSDWGCGWFVFVDTDDNGKWKAGEEILQTVLTPKNINVSHTAGSSNIKVDRYGMMSGLNAKGFIFAPEPAGVSSPATRGLCMSSGGRIKIIEDVPCS